jgi:uncharacterized protein with GYD domain
MPTFVMLTRLTPGAVRTPAALRRLEKTVGEHIRVECPGVTWMANYAILGPYDYLDVFEAPDEAAAAKAVMMVRSFGHAYTETWTALPWDRFEQLIPE